MTSACPTCGWISKSRRITRLKPITTSHGSIYRPTFERRRLHLSRRAIQSKRSRLCFRPPDFCVRRALEHRCEREQRDPVRLSGLARMVCGQLQLLNYPVAQTNLGSAIIEPVLPSGLMDSPWLLNTPSSDNPAVGQLSDNFSWTKGRHSMSFGFTLTRQLFKDANDSPAFAQVGLGLSGTDPMLVQFADTNLPNMGSFDLSTSGQLYGMLAGRVTSYGGSVALDPSTRQFTIWSSEKRQIPRDGFRSLCQR